MVSIVRYYLSAFHAARKGTIAKKPYNPILGETFRCYWDLPNSTRNPPSTEAKVRAGPACLGPDYPCPPPTRNLGDGLGNVICIVSM